MKRISILVGLLLIVSLAAAYPSARMALREAMGHEVPTQVVEPYVTIVAGLTGMKVPESRPRVLIIKDPAFFRDGSGNALGLYDIDPHKPDVIYLNFDMPVDQREATIVHELVHWLQEKNGWPAETCQELAAAEYTAYLTDALYTALYVDPKAPVFIPDLSCQ